MSRIGERSGSDPASSLPVRRWATMWIAAVLAKSASSDIEMLTEYRGRSGVVW